MGKFLNKILGIGKAKDKETLAPTTRSNDIEATPSGGSDTALTVREGALPLWMYGADGARTVSTVYACVKLLSEAVANLSLSCLRADGRGISRNDMGDRLWYLLNVAPSPWMSGFDMKARIVEDMHLWGNAYLLPIFNPVRGDWERLSIVRPWAVTHDTLNDLYEINDAEEGVSGTYTEEEVIHIKNTGPNPKHGLSTIGYARLSIDISRSGDIEAKNRTDDGGAVKGVLSNDKTMRGVGKYQDEQLQFAAIDMDSKFRSGQRIVHVPGTVEFKQLSMSSADMQFLESRKFAVVDICRFFGVNPSFVTGEGTSAYKSATETVDMFMLTTLNPLLRKIENELTRKLVSEHRIRERRIEFDRLGVYGCNPAGRMAYYSQMQQMGAATVNEVRALCGMQPVAGGDQLLVSANLRELNETKTGENNG